MIDETVATQIQTLERRLARERLARTDAERIAEEGMRELYQRTRHLELLETIAAHANGCDNPSTAIAFILEQICTFCDWPVGHAYRAEPGDDAEPSVLVSSGVFHASEPTPHLEFKAATARQRFAIDQGLPGRVWRAGSAVWVADVHLDENFPRRAAAQACGLQVGFGCPVFVGGELRLVLEFYSPRRLEVDPLLLRTLGQACAQLARVLERTDASEQAGLARTELQRLVTVAEEARRAAEHASETKSRFLANMSHEIRTPLNGVLGMVQVMERHELSSDQRERLAVVRQSGQGLLTILNDILDLAKVESGALELEQVSFDLPELLASVSAVIRPAAEAKALRLVTEVRISEPRRLGDPTRVRQLVQNLLFNALKFTDAGEVALKAVDGEGDRVRLEVCDTGIGIDAQHHDGIFASFAQADDSITRRFGGTGLGLSICRQLARAMEGDVTVESRLGEGSTFRIDIALPAHPIPDAAADLPPAASGDVKALRVLAAEDHAANRVVLDALLAGTGVDLMLVTNGLEAVQAWRANTFDLILMDVQMPVLDGREAALAIRGEESDTGRARTPIVALTANAMTHQIAEYQLVGMDGVVSKPIQAQALFRAIEQAVA